MTLLYRNKSSLDRQENQTYYDETLELYIRDNDESIDHIRFLFNDYRIKRWWFEVLEMYRRIIFIGIIPLTSTVPATRASFGIALAMVSLTFFREEKPYRDEFTNFIAYIAQIAILLTFYAAMSIETGVMMTFGLSGFGMGLFLVLCNISICFLVIMIGIYRFKKNKKKAEVIQSNAEKFEWAVSFNAEKFRTTFVSINERFVPTANVLLFHYTSSHLAKVAMRSGLSALVKFNGIPFTLHHPHQTNDNDKQVFGNQQQKQQQSSSSSSSTSLQHEYDVEKYNNVFPNEVLLVLSLPRTLLRPLKGYENEDYLYCIQDCILSAMRSLHPSNIVDVKPWVDGISLLPPTCILRAYSLIDLEEEKEESLSVVNRNSQGFSMQGLHLASRLSEVTEYSRRSSFINNQSWIHDVPLIQKNIHHHHHHEQQSNQINKVNYVEDFLEKMIPMRAQANKHNLIPLYHYTSPSLLNLIKKTGLRMSSQGQGDGGVYFSTRGPLSYDLGKPEYETNIIKDCFGIERVDEYLGKGKLDGVIVYGCEPNVLVQAPGGRKNAKMIPKSFFTDISLPQIDGNYFLRSDRILGIFIMNNNIRFNPKSTSHTTTTTTTTNNATTDNNNQVQFDIKNEILLDIENTKQIQINKNELLKQDEIIEKCISELLLTNKVLSSSNSNSGQHYRIEVAEDKNHSDDTISEDSVIGISKSTPSSTSTSASTSVSADYQKTDLNKYFINNNHVQKQKHGGTSLDGSLSMNTNKKTKEVALKKINNLPNSALGQKQGPIDTIHFEAIQISTQQGCSTEL